jgi:hypothetical protein
LNNEVAPKAVQGSTGANGRAGFAHVRANPGGSFREILDSAGVLSQDDAWHVRTSKDIRVVYGSQGGRFFGLRVPAARLVEDPKHTDEAGMLVAPEVFRAHDAGTTTNAASATVKVPDFAFGIG